MATLSEGEVITTRRALRIGIAWEGQCVHEWRYATEGNGQACVNCGTHCTRDAEGKIETYAAGGKH